MTRRNIQSHTALRGIAALLVVLYHFQFGGSFRFGWEAATPFFRKGYLWVDLFFILSGFVIAYSAQADERSSYRWAEIRKFWSARFARIYPLHLICLLAMFFIQAALWWLGRLTGKAVGDPELWTGLSIANFAEQLFLLNGWGVTGRIGWNIPSWSISAEAFAYLMFPAMAVLLTRGRGLAVALFLAGAGLFYAYVAGTSGNLDIVQGLAIARCLAGFSLGMILHRYRHAFERLPDAALSALQITGLALVIATLILGLNDVIAIPGFVMLVTATWPDRGLCARPLSTPAAQWLGDISYSVYLTHIVLLGPWRLIVPPIFERLGFSEAGVRAVLIIGGVMMILIASTLTYRFIENPSRSAINNWFAKRRNRSVESIALRQPDRLT